MDTSSCNPKNPFIQLDEDGQAAILSYQIPQESSYTVTGYVSLGVSKDKFKQAVVAQSTSPVWNSLEEIKQLDTTGIQQAVLTNNKILVGFKNFEWLEGLHEKGDYKWDALFEASKNICK